MLNKVFELICGFGPQQGTVGSCISQGKGQGMNLLSRIYRQGQAWITSLCHLWCQNNASANMSFGAQDI